MILTDKTDPNLEPLLGWFNIDWPYVVAREAFRIISAPPFNTHEWGFEMELLFHGDWQTDPASVIEVVEERRKIYHDK